MGIFGFFILDLLPNILVGNEINQYPEKATLSDRQHTDAGASYPRFKARRPRLHDQQ